MTEQARRVEVEVDAAADVAYIRLSREAVVQSVELGDDVVVDLDGMRMVVGIEMLHLDAEIPYSTLVSDWHVHSDVADLLRRIRPSISGFLSLQSMAEGTVAADRKAALV